jgi:formate hydrogenlyase subunit 6/NADH:ubiquinone oxidoreductase subunit I
MPAQVVVVKRSQRDAFAAPRSAPAWLRAVWIGLARSSRSLPDTTGLADRPIGAGHLPRLARDDHGRHRCIGCELCVELCPSHSLALELGDSDAGGGIERFELDPGRCIGCGLCGEACPEDAIELHAAAWVAPSAGPGRPLRIDLLAQRV